ncbi:glycosyltransferase family 2 protein [Thermodesulfobacteriota bacterium]
MSDTNCIKLSIITVCFNSEEYIEHALKSIQCQRNRNFEYIVIDGGSTDSTLKIIDYYKPSVTLFISEPDEGIADAMNKGINKASGNYILFLGADDYLPARDTIDSALHHIDGSSDFCIYDVFTENNGKRRLLRSKPFGWWTNFKMSACHQGQVIAKSLFDRLGGFDTSYKYTMDYEFVMRAYRTGVRSSVINLPLSVMRLTGISSRRDWVSLKERFDEERRIHQKYCPSMFMRMVYSVYWTLYLPYRGCRSYFETAEY